MLKWNCIKIAIVKKFSTLNKTGAGIYLLVFSFILVFKIWMEYLRQAQLVTCFKRMVDTWSMTPRISSRKKKHSFSMFFAPLTLTSMTSHISPAMTSRLSETRLSTFVRQYLEPPRHWKRSQSVSHFRPKYRLVISLKKFFN